MKVEQRPIGVHCKYFNRRGTRELVFPDISIVISFSNEDMENVTSRHDDALVITTEMNDLDVKRIFVDSRSSTDVLFLDAFLAMGMTKKELQKVDFLLIDFAVKDRLPPKSYTPPCVFG